MMQVSLTHLPNEVILHILFYLPPDCVPALQQVSQRFNDLAQPLLWKYHCRTQFKHWSEEHCMREKLSDNASKVDWKLIFTKRHNIDRAVSRELDSILSSQLGRNEKIQRIACFGYDAKDTLLRHLNIGEEAEDVLARRYYSAAALGCLHRSMAVKEWLKLMDARSTSLERALAAYDMFVLHDRDGDFDDISTLLDGIAEQIRLEHPELSNQSPRQRALIVAAYMRRNNLTGLQSDRRYHDLQNNFMGVALQDEDHPSLPLVSVVIYCSVAKRLGLDAQPCGFPFHVYAIIKHAEDLTLDGRAWDSESVENPMYMDPFRSDQEIPIQALRAQLSQLGVSSTTYATLLDASPTVDIIHRTGLNILTSIRTPVHNLNALNHEMVPRIFPEMESAFYGALWALLLLPEAESLAFHGQRNRYLPHIMDCLEKQFSMDTWLIEEHILPLFYDLREHRQLHDTLRLTRVEDTMPKQVRERTEKISKSVRYKVGQVFQHKRYHYQAVIIGWDVECKETERWMAQMGVHQLTGGRHQSFYHVLVEDKSTRYVAQENIDLAEIEVSCNLTTLAGRYFKRWDKSSRVFISNIEDEYPDG